MGVLGRFFGASPFAHLLEHTRKVHECVQLLKPLTKALLDGDREKIEELHHQISGTEHEADEIKASIRQELAASFMFSVRRDDLMRFLSYQDDVADAAEDFAVVALLHVNQVPLELREEFLAFVEQVIRVTEHLLSLAEELPVLVESAFQGKEAAKFKEGIDAIGKEEWEADKLQRRFARHFYQLEGQLSTVDLIFFDKYCTTLGAVANAAEKTAKYLRQILAGR